MLCPNCGNELPDHAKFCGKCGQKLGSQPSPVYAQAAAPAAAAAPVQFGNAQLGSYQCYFMRGEASALKEVPATLDFYEDHFSYRVTGKACGWWVGMIVGGIIGFLLLRWLPIVLVFMSMGCLLGPVVSHAIHKNDPKVDVPYSAVSQLTFTNVKLHKAKCARVVLNNGTVFHAGPSTISVQDAYCNCFQTMVQPYLR